MTHERLPEWLKVDLGGGKGGGHVRGILARHGVHTVCQAAECPNRAECFQRQVATFLILGEICTRGCAFCAVTEGDLRRPDPAEPAEVAAAASALQLKHVVLTSVTRDDLPDGGAGHFAATVQALRNSLPDAVLEVLTPDFSGDLACVDQVLDAGVDVFNHNIETVPRLYNTVRRGADYQRSLSVLAHAARHTDLPVKSGFMLGLGEESDEIIDLLTDLYQHGVRWLTIGQYLRPRRRNLPVVRYVPPAEFDAWGEKAREIGFEQVFSGPLVRSSYMAEQMGKERHGA